MPTDATSRSRSPRRGRRPSVLALVAAVGLATACLPGVCYAQGPESFGDVLIPAAPIRGEIALRARKAWTWQAGSGVPTQRLVLEGDVYASFGGYTFRAERAAVWLQRVQDDPTVYQVFAVLDRVDAPEADARIAIVADRLPVQGLVETSEPILLSADLRLDGPPPASGRAGASGVFLAEAEDSFEVAIAAARGVPIGSDVVIADAARPGRIEQRQPFDDFADDPRGPGGVRSITGSRTRAAEARARSSSIFVGTGVFSFAVGDRAVVRTGEDANRLILTGGVVVQYTDARSGNGLDLKAERAVVFLKPGALGDTLESLDADTVEGIYLEGEVLASDGTYTLRSPRMYYDVRNNKALVLDAVFWTYEQRTGMPLYLRADALRQEARSQFSAERARLANTAFFNPHFTLGVRDVTVTVYEEDRNAERLGGRTEVDAKNITLQGAQVPFLWWPRYKGDPEQFPLRNIQYVDSNRRGAGVQSSWNAFSLLGIDPGEGQAADLDIDYYADSGLGLGLRAEWDRIGWIDHDHEGAFSGYILPDDRGSDFGPTGREFERDGDLRGYARAEERIRLAEPWELLLEGAWISDPLFLESYFPEQAERNREITSRAEFRRQDGIGVLSLAAKATALDFIPNQVILQSPGYTVDKVPELSYLQIARDVFADTYPGVVTHTWEISAAHMRLRFSEVDARAYGYRFNSEAARAFGTDIDESLGDLHRAAGLREDYVTRVDTRHEVAAQFDWGPLRLNPFVVGRLTAYDSDFPAYSPGEQDNLRWWAAGGVRLSTEITRVFHGVDNPFLDVHKIRHIIEPSVTIWTSGTNINAEDLPVYDDDVENLNDDSVVRLAVEQTFQTKRGGAGRWRNVDWLTLDAEYVHHSDDDHDRRGPIGRYFDARPELSNPGEYARVSSVWRASEVVALTAETIYDFDASQQARSSAGIAIEHRPGFITTIEWRFINPLDVAYLTGTALYTLTDKYQVRLWTDYNFDEEQFQRFRGEILRAFPNGVLGLTLGVDTIRSETSLGFVFRPFGLRGAPAANLGDSRSAFGG